MFAKWLLPVSLALAGCATAPQNNGTLVRVHNMSAQTLGSVRVQFSDRVVSYGTLAPGQTSEYRPADGAYRYAYMEATVDGTKRTFQPIDYVGETRLGPGRYTYHVSIDRPSGSLLIDGQPDP